MRTLLAASIAALLSLSALPALAASRTVILSVPGMTCAACPLTVKAALSKVAGVTKAVVDYDRRQATVTFDDARTSVAELTRATENAGYPSTPVADK
jgi:mercuric ion binding protein